MLLAKLIKCKFMWHPKESHGYYFYNSNEQKVFVSKHRHFLEKEFLHEGSNESKINLEET